MAKAEASSVEGEGREASKVAWEASEVMVMSNSSLETPLDRQPVIRMSFLRMGGQRVSSTSPTVETDLSAQSSGLVGEVGG